MTEVRAEGNLPAPCLRQSGICKLLLNEKSQGDEYKMVIMSSSQALAILDDYREAAGVREAAIRYLADRATPAVIARLVRALQDDDFGVRWEAANRLAQLGEPALLEALKGPAAEIASLVAAYWVLRALKEKQSEKTLAGKVGTATTRPPSLPGEKYSSARLTGQLSRLNRYHID